MARRGNYWRERPALINSVQSCCLGCEKRSMGCRASCPDWSAFQEAVEAQRKARRDKYMGNPASLDPNYTKER